MASLETAASLATAGGTLILAIATFASIRSANRAARTAERSLLAGSRPVLMPARQGSPQEKVRWVDGHHTLVSGNVPYVGAADGSLYLAMSLRNVGTGMAVLLGWRLVTDWIPGSPVTLRTDGFRAHTRDLYIAPGDTGYWQAALRDSSDPEHGMLAQALRDRVPINVDLEYGDHEVGQRTISRFGMHPAPGGEGWYTQHSRHWDLDHDGARLSYSPKRRFRSR